MSEVSNNNASCNIAMIGLGVMGNSMALNLIDNGFNVVGFDLNLNNVEKTRSAALSLHQDGEQKGQFVAALNLGDVLSALESPRVIALSVPAGHIVEAVIDDLIECGLKQEDIVIDTGNSLWTDTIAREDKYKGSLRFFSTAVSGGEEGARFGPALMASGEESAWQYVKPMWEAISAKVDEDGMPLPPFIDGEPCAAYTGPSGSGHYVKMVHNGIEYADMQLICEVYQFLSQTVGMSAAEVGKVFEKWNQGVLNSYLMEISADILQQVDETTGKPLVEVILDKAGQKGTGLWTAVSSLQAGCPTPTIAQAVYARALSGLKDQRVKASRILMSVCETAALDKDEIIEQLHDALYCAKLTVYAQGFDLMKSVSDEQNWNLDFTQIAKIWRAGCIIRAIFLQSISKAYEKEPELENLLFDSHFVDEITKRQMNWRKAVANSALYGVAMPGISSGLQYFDSIRMETLPANLLQAQRDYFGSHTYSRIDQPESYKYHVVWSKKNRTEIKVS